MNWIILSGICILILISGCTEKKPQIEVVIEGIEDTTSFEDILVSADKFPQICVIECEHTINNLLFNMTISLDTNDPFLSIPFVPTAEGCNITCNSVNTRSNEIE